MTYCSSLLFCPPIVQRLISAHHPGFANTPLVIRLAFPALNHTEEMRSFLRSPIPAGQSQFPKPALSYNIRNTLEGPDIRYNADSCFPDGEDGVLSRQPDITGAGKIDASADTITVNSGNNMFPAFFDRGYTRLEVHDFSAEFFPVYGRPVSKKRLGRNKVQSGRKTLSLRPDNDNTHIGIFIKRLKKPAYLLKKLHCHRVALLRFVQNQPSYVSGFFNFKKQFVFHADLSFIHFANSPKLLC
jgi:hypothetical protein